MQRIIDSEKSKYMDTLGICKMFNVWNKKINLVQEAGRPSVMKLDETEDDAVMQVLQEHTNNSNAF